VGQAVSPAKVAQAFAYVMQRLGCRNAAKRSEHVIMYFMRSDLFFKVEVEHEPGEDVRALGAEIARQIQKLYIVRSAELSSFTTSEE
jgi:hypothetical protein